MQVLEAAAWLPQTGLTVGLVRERKDRLACERRGNRDQDSRISRFRRHSGPKYGLQPCDGVEMRPLAPSQVVSVRRLHFMRTSFTQHRDCAVPRSPRQANPFETIGWTNINPQLMLTGARPIAHEIEAL